MRASRMSIGVAARMPALVILSFVRAQRSREEQQSGLDKVHRSQLQARVQSRCRARSARACEGSRTLVAAVSRSSGGYRM